MKISLLIGASALALALVACGDKKEAAASSATPVVKNPAAESIVRGEAIYKANCQACHQPGGAGMNNLFPPLANADWFKNDSKKVITAVVKGVTGKITVNGKEYNSAMPPVKLDDAQTADVVNYVVSSFGNSGATVTADDVKALR